ncbi:MAG TPA: hypothetical protein VN791_04920 [Acidimicrobiales bacterium]|nr:hypothetical protein [Acidimicrobiales bacterium]
MSGPDATSPHRRVRSAQGLALAFAAYLTVSVVMWWNVWSTHPTSVTTCGCGDASLFLWFLEWPAYALAHGHNPFYSTALFHPAGIDLLSNTSVLAIGIPLAPVTWLFGPVATLNVASTLGPALTALSMFWLLRRWVRWTPAAFVGGLVFGFSPFAFVNVAGGHLMSGVLVLVPLMVACLDELLVRQRRRPAVTGGVLGLLVVVQFFLSTEILTIVVLCSAVGVALVLAYAALARSGDIGLRAPHALRGLGVAAAVAVVLLAYPLWFTLEGPAHLSGLVWPTLEPGAGGIVLGNLWHLRVMTALRNVMQTVGGYEGPALPQGEYLGPGLLVVVGAGLVLWWRDRRLWFFGGLGVITVVLSLGVETHYWVPWRILARVPLIQSIIPGRFIAATTLCAAVLVAIVVDRTHDAVGGWAGRAGAAGAGRRSVVAPAVVALAGVASLVVAAAATVPMATAVAGNVPLTTRAVTLPSWFADVAPHLPPHQVVLVIPAPFSLIQSAMAWQAVDSLHFAMVGGSGPEGVPARAGKERAGMEVVSAASISLDGPPDPTPATVDAVRRALAGWGVTEVVIPDPTQLPRYDQGTNPPSALGLFTVAIGRMPRFRDAAWVWSGVEVPGPELSIAQGAFDRCTTDQLWRSRPQAVPDCVTAAARATT